MDISDKIIILTGASGGIGVALAKRFLREQPAHLLLLDVNADGLETLAAELASACVETGICDVTDPAAVAGFVTDVERRFGQVNLFCSNAGIFLEGGADAPVEAWRYALNVNLMSHIHAVQACLPGTLRCGQGYFLRTISAAGLLTQIGSAPYSVSKHAALGFAEWVAVTHGEQGIRVTALCPQGVQTRMLDDIGDVNSVAGDGLLSAEVVAESALEAIVAERFLALPHERVADYFRRKATDYDRWITGMQRFQSSLFANDPTNQSKN